MLARNCGESRPWESCRRESAQCDEYGGTVLIATWRCRWRRRWPL